MGGVLDLKERRDFGEDEVLLLLMRKGPERVSGRPNSTQLVRAKLRPEPTS